MSAGRRRAGHRVLDPLRWQPSWRRFRSDAYWRQESSFALAGGGRDRWDSYRQLPQVKDLLTCGSCPAAPVVPRPQEISSQNPVLFHVGGIELTSSNPGRSR